MEKNCAYSRSDLACECIETKRGGLREYERYGFRCTELTIRAGGEEKIYKNSAGRYVTMSPGRLWLWDDRRAARFTDALADEITDFFEAASKQKISESSSVLVCGIGNRFITSDALGPQTLDKLTVTRHAVGCGGILDSLGCSRISAIVPGTLGQTGMEALTIIKGGIALSEDPRDHVLGVCAVYRLFRCSINYSGVGHNGERAEKGGEHLRKACSAPEFFRRTDKTFLTGFTSSRNFCVHICLPHTEFSLA